MAPNLHGELAGRHIGLLTASASRDGGGVFEAVVAQAALVRSFGARATVFALTDRHSAEDRTRFGTSEVVTVPVLGPKAIGYAPQLVSRMMDSALDCLHLHGIWMYPSRAGAAWARRTGKPYLISPHGMLDPWITARGRWKKALARAGYERDSWRRAAFLHALTPREANDIACETGRQDSMVIPNPAPAAVADATVRGNEIFYIGRIHPKKNLQALVEGWRMAGLPPGASLTIAGWGDDASVAALRETIGGASDIAFIGPCFGPDKQARLRSARFTILPSLSEGLPMSVLEGWANGTPAIMTRECNLPEGLASGAAIECGFVPPAIAAAIEYAVGLPHAAWQAMSDAALALASGPFSAATVAGRWADAYAMAMANRDRGSTA